jgi:hypothetical protein
VTNLAARLSGEATGGQILVPQRVCAVIEEIVEMEPVGELTLKGFAKPVPAFNVVRLKETADSAFVAARAPETPWRMALEVAPTSHFMHSGTLVAIVIS